MTYAKYTIIFWLVINYNLYPSVPNITINLIISILLGSVVAVWLWHIVNAMRYKNLSNTLISKQFYNVTLKQSKTNLFKSLMIIVSGIALIAIGSNFKEILGDYSILPSIFGAVVTALGGFWLPKK